MLGFFNAVLLVPYSYKTYSREKLELIREEFISVSLPVYCFIIKPAIGLYPNEHVLGV
jgi:hypothetical protein